MDLLQLLKRLGYLEGSEWYPVLVGEQVKVRVYSLEDGLVTFGISGEAAQRINSRYFLQWFKPKISRISNTSVGVTKALAMRSKSCLCTTVVTPTSEL